MIRKTFGEIITKQTLQNRAKRLSLISLCALAIVAITSAFAMQQNSEFPTTSHECTQVTLDDIDESLLTKEEKIARLDVSLSDSIDSYTTCVNTVQKQMAGGGSGSNSGGGSAGEQGAESASGGVQSAAGGEQSQEKTQTGQQQSTGSQAGSSAVEQSQNSTTNVKRGVVAPKDNDSIICTLLYEEIQKANADSLVGLEKQYQDYKCGK